MNWKDITYLIVLPVVISYFSVWLDQKWHAIREFKAAYARCRSLGKDSVAHPEKVTLDSLFTMALSELQYRTQQAGKCLDDVLYQLEEDVPGKKFRIQ